MPRNCRDCSACTRPSAVRGLYLVFVATWLWMFSWMWLSFMRKCPQCRHLLGKHSRRQDGSYID